MWATSTGTPAWRSAQARIAGPSFSRKKRLRAVSARKNTIPERSLMPAPRPWSSAFTEALAEALALSLASFAVVGSTPRSSSQPSIVLLAPVSSEPMSPLSLAMPATISTTRPTARTTIESINRPAAAARGMCRPSLETRGVATAATTPAVITGNTIVSVRASSHTIPTSSTVTPTSSHAVRPRSRSHPGVANRPVSSRGSSSTTSSVLSVPPSGRRRRRRPRIMPGPLVDLFRRCGRSARR